MREMKTYLYWLHKYNGIESNGDSAERQSDSKLFAIFTIY